MPMPCLKPALLRTINRESGYCAGLPARVNEMPEDTSYRCTSCGGDAYIAYSAGNGDWGGKVKAGERICLACGRKRGIALFEGISSGPVNPPVRKAIGLTISKIEGTKMYEADDKSVPGAPLVGRGFTMKEAIGDWVINHQDQLGMVFIVEQSAFPPVKRRRTKVK